MNSIISISVNIDPNDDCIDLSVFIGGGSGSVFSIPNGDSRNGQWSIKISQFNCGFNNLPPQGCTQWYFGQLSGIVRYLEGRYHSRFFVRVGHETTYAAIGNHNFFTIPCHCQTYQN